MDIIWNYTFYFRIESESEYFRCFFDAKFTFVFSPLSFHATTLCGLLILMEQFQKKILNTDLYFKCY